MIELTPRQRQALELIIQDKRNKDIAATLQLSERATESLLTRAYRRMGVRSRVGAAIGYIFLKLRTIDD